MSASGLIYDSSWSRSSGTVWLCLAEAEGESGLCLDEVPTPGRDEVGPSSLLPTSYSLLHKSRSAAKFFANLMLLIGGAGVLLTMLPVAAIEVQYAYKSYTSYRTDKTYLSSPPPPTESGPPPGPASAAEAFSISIPKISASSVVVPNVDPADPKIYAPALKQGVAHALGTGLPGVASQINRTIYLFAHSTSAPSLVAQYNAQFYLLNKLEVGDEINITFWAQNYKYRVTEIKITDPSDVSFLTPQTAKEILVLATCAPPGTTWKRLLVLAEPIEPLN